MEEVSGSEYQQKDLQLGGLSHNDIAIRILADVVSRYERDGKHEALVAAGTLALGREPCKSYPGWGVIAP
jgi:D-serine deaminase-like pyridoxal phosphate-dependent protein